MTQVRIKNTRETFPVPLGSVLIVTPSRTTSAGRVTLNTSGVTPAGPWTAAGGAPTTIGPFTNAAEVTVESTSGTIFAEVTSAISTGGGAWGAITGTLASQTDLSNALAGKVATTSVGVAGGVAGLDGTGKVPAAQLPASGSTNATPVQITASRALLASDNGATLYSTDSTPYALTVPSGLGIFSCVITQLSTGTLSCSPGSGVTMAVTGSTAGANTSVVLSKADASAEVYDLKLPTIVPAKASSGQATTGTDDATYMTPLKTAAAVAAFANSYVYVGLSTGLAAAVPSPTDGQIVKLTDTAWGGSGGSSGYGTEWIYVGHAAAVSASEAGWFPKAPINIATINSAAGVSGLANATAQYIGAYQLPAITSGKGKRIRVCGTFGKTGTAGTCNFALRVFTTTGTGTQMVPAQTLTAAQLSSGFEGEFMYDSATSVHQTCTTGPSASALPTAVGMTSGVGVYINPNFTPVSTDTPILYALNATLYPYGGT